MYDKKLWEECTKFHRHTCPGLAIGFKASEYIRELFGIKASIDEEIVCVTENDACGVDAISYVLGCSLGKGNLIFRDRGKSAYTFFNRDTKEKIRLVKKESTKGLSREQSLKYILESNPLDIFEVKKPNYEIPKRAALFESRKCESCGEITSENKLRVQSGQLVCLDCFNEYTRGW